MGDGLVSPSPILHKRYGEDYARMYCVIERMSCLIPILKDERTRGFTYEESDATRLGVRHALFPAVAKCPLRCDDEHARFDPEEFIEIVFGHPDPGLVMIAESKIKAQFWWLFPTCSHAIVCGGLWAALSVCDCNNMVVRRRPEGAPRSPSTNGIVHHSEVSLNRRLAISSSTDFKRASNELS
jgi:hypothetical protein